MAIRLGDEAPNFSAESTAGQIDFHDYLGDGWGVLFSHPKELRLTSEFDAEALSGVTDVIKDLPADPSAKDASERLRQYCGEKQLRFAAFMKFLRLVFTGLNQGPPVGEMINIFGRENALARIKHGIKVAKA